MGKKIFKNCSVLATITGQNSKQRPLGKKGTECEMACNSPILSIVASATNKRDFPFRLRPTQVVKDVMEGLF